MKRAFRTLALATTASTLLLIAWGGLVRATGSGDGCPDWPKCFGSYVPRLEYHTLIEYVHRLLAVVSGGLAVALAIMGIVAIARRRDVNRGAAWLAAALAPMFLIQGILGGAVVLSSLDPAWITVHFAFAMVVLATVVAIAVLAKDPAPGGDRGYARLTTWTAAACFVLLLAGTYVRAEGAGLAFRDWPLMGGRLVPSITVAGAVEMFVHRFLAVIVAALVVWCAVRARTLPGRSRPLVLWSTVAVLAVLAQVVLGGILVSTDLATAPRSAHVGLAAALWASLVALAIHARRSPESALAATPPAQEQDLTKETLRAYVALTKPRIIVLLLITTVPAMILAAGAVPSLWLIAATLLGGSLAAGAANAINMYLDRDIDQVMRRTRDRPLPQHRIAPERALTFGFSLAVASFVFLALTVNVLAALLALGAIGFYVFVYTMWLKRSTDQNIVIGGAAGGAPVLVGWAAVTGTLALPAWVLFAVIFVWTPPHFWALAMRIRDDYAAAGVPMMPVVRGEDETRKQIFIYSVLLVAVTLVLVPVAPMGAIYLVAALALGGVFVARALQLWRSPSRDRAWQLFRYSMLYLATLFVAVAVDALV
jgi:protoheme IX farnesyltransferase